jgi:hypothetical protein
MQYFPDLPYEEVTEAEFIRRRMEEAGEPREEAEFQAYMAKYLGSSVLTGGKMLKIKEESNGP